MDFQTRTKTNTFMVVWIRIVHIHTYVWMFDPVSRISLEGFGGVSWLKKVCL